MENSEKYHIQKLQSSCKVGFKWLYDKYHSKLYYFILKLVRNTETAEEITSEVFLRLWQKREAIDPAGSISGLLFKIARDCSMGHLRKIARKSDLREAYIQQYTKNISANTSEDDLFFKEYMALAENAINQLPPKGKQVFIMRYKEHLDLHQIAAKLDISPNTVKVHLNRSSRAVKEYLRLNSDLIFILLAATLWSIP